jgi:hypothetical protein
VGGKGRPFVKGQSGNPRGRPKRGAALSDFARWAVMQPAAADAARSRGQAIAEALVAQAMAGEVAAIKLLFDRLDGPVPQVVTGEGGGPIAIIWPWQRDPEPASSLNGQEPHAQLPAP